MYVLACTHGWFPAFCVGKRAPPNMPPTCWKTLKICHSPSIFTAPTHHVGKHAPPNTPPTCWKTRASVRETNCVSAYQGAQVPGYRVVRAKCALFSVANMYQRRCPKAEQMYQIKSANFVPGPMYLPGFPRGSNTISIRNYLPGFLRRESSLTKQRYW